MWDSHSGQVKPAARKACFTPALVFTTGILIAIATTAHAGQQTARLTMFSEPGDFIGQGQAWDITYPADEISVSIRDTLSNGEPAHLEFNVGRVFGDQGNWSLLFFGTDQLGIKMQPGEYSNAERSSFASPGHPGLDVSFQHRGCNQVTGAFTVTDATFSGTTLESFSVFFEQHCEGSPPALFGVFTYSATDSFTDDPLVPGETHIRRVHITQLRARIAVLQARLILRPYSYTDPDLTAGTTMVRAQHILDLRAALAEVYDAAGRTPPAYTDPSLAAGITIKAVHISELRAAIVALE